MLYSAYITSLRRQCGDNRRRVHVDFQGNGQDTIFQLPDDTFPVYDDSTTYEVHVGGVEATLNTDYSLDVETGTIEFLLGAPANGTSVSFYGSAVYVTNAGWIQIINDAISSLGDDFFKEFVNTSLTTTQNMLSLSLVATLPQCMAVYEFQYRRNTSEDWKPVEDFVNWRYDNDNNIIYIGNRDAFTATGELLRIRGLSRYILGAAVGATVDVQDKFLTVVEYAALARFWRYRYKQVVELVSKNVTEGTRTPLQELIMLSDRFDRLYELEKAKLKPQKPARIIPVRHEGGGRP